MQRGQIRRPFQPFERRRAQRRTMCSAVGLFAVMSPHAQPRHANTDQQPEYRQQQRRRWQDQRRRAHAHQRQRSQRQQRADGTHQQAVDFADVAQQARQQIASAGRAQPCRRQRQRAAEEPHAQIAGDAQGGVMPHQFFEVARCDARHGQPADAGRRSEEIEALAKARCTGQRCSGQEAAGQAQQRGAGQHRGPQQQHRQQQARAMAQEHRAQ
ncbi:hypothetical protein D3C81_580310 [compost metagenome]